MGYRERMVFILPGVFLAAAALLIWFFLPGIRKRTAPDSEIRSPRTEKDGKTGITWVHIKGNVFSMGSDDGRSNEKPVRDVRVDDFKMAKSPVTVEQYTRCVRAGGCSPPGAGDGEYQRKEFDMESFRRDNHPVTGVNWHEAVQYCTWAGGRLPSEAEWEYAARSRGKAWNYPWGDVEPTCERVVMQDGQGPGCGLNGAWPVCYKEKGNTREGLCDMAGNVWEWVQDWYYRNYDDAPTDGKPREYPPGSFRVLRGGAFFNTAYNLRTTNRGSDDPDGRSAYQGFRCTK